MQLREEETTMKKLVFLLIILGIFTVACFGPKKEVPKKSDYVDEKYIMIYVPIINENDAIK